MSPLEKQVEFRLKLLKVPAWKREYRFHKIRRWRFDFAWPEPDLRVSIECEGGIWSGGRHVRGKGFENDVEKYNQALLQGWKVYRVVPSMVNDGSLTELILRIFDVGEKK